MKWQSRSSQQKQKMPHTQVYHLLDDQMTLVVRAWGSQEYNQKLIEETSFYLSSAQADIDVTSPFDMKENLSSLANKTRISLLLAHDYFYKNVNKTEFTVGFELAVFFKIRNELAWSSVGRFSLKKIHSGYMQTLFEVGSDIDSEVLLPVSLLGAEADTEVISGSLYLQPQSQLLLSSVFSGQLVFQASNAVETVLLPINNDMTYWYSLIKAD